MKNPPTTSHAVAARRLIPEPGLRAYFGAVFVGVFLALGGTAYLALGFAQDSARDRLLQAIEAADSQAVAAMQRTARETLVQITADLLVLRSLFEHYLKQPDGRGDLDRIALEFMRRQRGYDQLRFIAMNGDEVVRIDNGASGPSLRRDAELQNKMETDYFSSALRISDDQVLISQLQFNREKGRIEQPLKPVIRVLAPIDLDDERRGFVVLNFLAQELLAQIRVVGDAAIGSPLVVSALGIEALSTFAAKSLDKLPSAPGFAERHPSAWSYIQERAAGATSDGRGGLFIFSRYFPGTEAMPERVGESVAWTLPRADGSGEEGGLYLISHVDPDSLTLVTDLGVGASKILAALFLTIMLGLAWFVALRFAHLRSDTRRMHTLATRDALTGILNRGEFELRVRQVLAQARRHNRAMALLFIDLNGFKQINDKLGHAAGDEMLRLTAGILTGSVRSSDLVGRLGGDEFAVVLSEIRGRHDTRAVADKLRERLNTEVEVAGQIVSMGASVGCATFPEDADSADGLFDAADRAMYREKNEHRAAVATPAASAA